MARLSSVLRLCAGPMAREGMCSVQAKYLDEGCIAVDENDRPLRRITKRECHSADTLTLHRAFSVFLFTSSGQLVLQKRSSKKLTFPSVWSNSCCSHPLWTPEELRCEGSAVGVRIAAQRKLRHELGVAQMPLSDMHVMGRFIYKSMSDGEWGEHEIDYAIVVPNFDPSKLEPNPNEVEAVALIGQQQLGDFMLNGERFSPWFQLFVRERFLALWWRNLDKLNKFEDISTIHRLK